MSPAAPSATSCHNLYEIPVQDSACAMSYGGNHTDIMSKCCKSADVVSYYNGCGLYCLSMGQTVEDLITCLQGNGASYSDVFCQGNTTQSATATSNGNVPETAGAKVVASGGSSSSSGSDKSGGGSDKGSGAGLTRPQSGSTTLGLAIGALLFTATAFGALV